MKQEGRWVLGPIDKHFGLFNPNEIEAFFYLWTWTADSDVGFSTPSHFMLSCSISLRFFNSCNFHRILLICYLLIPLFSSNCRKIVKREKQKLLESNCDMICFISLVLNFFYLLLLLLIFMLLLCLF